MRFVIQFELPVEVGNAFEKDPKFLEILAQWLEQLKPEAAYFSSSRRYVIVISEAESHEELSKLLVPIWHTFKVYPQVEPVITAEEAKAVFPKLAEIIKNL
ncbi:MAG: hypothetical protein GTN80_07605 [Nitrososphaeria archaeon]|nr:hypothetical protein [Nitrososphaeria archaeon]NIN52931.1 hypothetical protein [Nitrososphaeria archaeon]NIQ33490.1 hypothetical protein [Nitrososphaeria archaeon]